MKVMIFFTIIVLITIFVIMFFEDPNDPGDFVL